MDMEIDAVDWKFLFFFRPTVKSEYIKNEMKKKKEDKRDIHIDNDHKRKYFIILRRIYLISEFTVLLACLPVYLRILFSVINKSMIDLSVYNMSYCFINYISVYSQINNLKD